MTTRYPLVLNGTSIQELQNSDSLILPSALSISSGGTGLTSFTSGGVVYASSSSALATGSALTFDGTSLFTNGGIFLGGVASTGNAGDIGLPNSRAIRFRNAANSGYLNALYVDSSNNLQLGAGTSDVIISVTGLGEAMRVASSTGGRGAVGIGYSSLTSVGDNGLAVLGNVGIGTSSPAYKLDVNGTMRSTAAGTWNSSYTSTTGGLVFCDNTNGGGAVLNIRRGRDVGTGNVDGIALDALNTAGNTVVPMIFRGSPLYINDGTSTTTFTGGNLGLGVTPSASWSSSWSVEQFGQAGTLFAYKSGSNYTVLSNNSYASGASYQGGDAKYTNAGYSTAYVQNNSGQHLWLNAGSGTAGNAITFTQAMTLTSASQLLIGSTSAAGSLDSGTLQVGSGFSGITNTGSVVAPTIVTSGSLEFNIDGVSGTQRHGRITGNGDTSAGAYAGGLTFEYYGFSGSAYQWYTGMTMSSVGTINTTSAASNAMNIVYNGSWTGGNANFVTMYMSNMTGGTAGLALGKAGGTYNTSKIIFGYAGSGSSSNYLGLGFWDADSRFTLYPTGNASLTGTLTQNTSDDRLKTDFVVIKNALSKVRALSGFTHAWNDLAVKLNSADPTIRESGVSAQKVKEVLPEAVCIAPFDQVKGNRFASESGEDYLTVMYEKLVPLLIEAIKELDGEISILKTKQGV